MNVSDIGTVIYRLYQTLRDSNIPNYLIFLGFAILSFLIGQNTPGIVRFIIYRLIPQHSEKIDKDFIIPIQQSFKAAGTSILITLSLVWLEDYKGLHNFVKPFVELGLTISLSWLCSRLFRQSVRAYGIDIIRKSSWAEFDELLLVIETIVNIIIGFVAVIGFARSQGIQLVGLLAGFGLGGIALSFAASKTLEQLLGTVVLYLDKPFIPGEYIRLPDKLYGRVESIGLRSTKIRAVAKSTLFIIPNSILANLEIENVTRGKKVMVLLYLDFTKKLEEREQAVVKQVVKESTDSLLGIDPGSTNITTIANGTNDNTRARVTFFILGSSEDSIQLRKRLLELANNRVSRQLKDFGIEFMMQEPNIYVESTVPI